MNNKIRILKISICFFVYSCQALVLVKGNVTDGSETMSFNIGNLLIDPSGSNIFAISSGNPTVGDAPQYSISTMYANQSKASYPTLFPLCPAIVTFNGTNDTTNPLYEKTINKSTMYQTFPAVSVQENVYWVAGNVGTQRIAVYTHLTPLQDASNTANCSNVAGLVSMGSPALVAAVAPNGGAFGENNSGLALLRYNEGTKEDPTKFLNIIGPTITLDPTSPVLTAGTHDLNAMSPTIAMHYDTKLGRMYAGVSVESGDNIGDKAVSVCAGYLNNNTLTLMPIAGNAAIINDCIVGTATKNTQIDASLINVMHTSTGLDYLVFSSTGKYIYALPLVNLHANPANTTWQTDPTHGALAKKNTLPTNYYQKGLGANFKYFAGRGFQTPAIVADDLYNGTTPADTALIVVGEAAIPTGGNGALSVNVYRDTIFVTVAQGSSDQSGVFYSQALFDANGVISGWTAWQRVVLGNSNQQIKSTLYVPSFDALYTVQNDTSLYFSSWSDGAADGLLGGTTNNASVGLIQNMNTFFGPNGVQGIFDFPYTTTAFNPAQVSATESYQIYTGNGQCAIVRTLSGTNDFYVPAIGAFTVNPIADTAITFPGISGINTITGKTIKNLGAITAATIAGQYGQNTRFIFLGGSGGLAYADINNGGALTVIPGFSYVRKIWVDGAAFSSNVPYVYVLTNKALYRLSYNEATFDQVTLATIASLNLMSQSTFSDVTIVNNYALLATSLGFFQSQGSGVDIATGITDLTWQKITLPNNVQAVTRLSLISTTTSETDYITQNKGGNLYVLCADVPNKKALVYRYAINGTSLQFIPDTFPSAQNDINPYMYFTEYRNYYCANNALNFSMAPQYLSTFSFIQTTDQSGQARPQKIPFGVLNGDTMGNLVRSGALGSMMIYGNFGVRVHE